MDILNNIWTAISTPNEYIVNIMSLFLLIIEAPLSFSLIKHLFNINSTKKNMYIYITTISSVSIISLLILNWPYNVALNYISVFLVLYFIFKLNILKTLAASVFPSIIFNLVGSLLFNPYLTLFNLSYEEATTIPIHRFCFSIIMYFLIYLFVLILKHKNLKLNILETLDSKNKIIIILNIIFGIFNIIIQGILTVNYIDILPIQFTFFIFVCLLVYFGLSFFSMAKIMSLVTTTKKLESAEEYNKTLHILHDSVRGFKHDFDNIVTTIGGYIKTNDMTGLENYYSQLEEDCEKVNNLYILNPDIINNPGIYNLLTTKYNEAEEKGIKVNLTFLLDLNNLHMKIYEFARILGILLDNAIEASSECEEKILNIVFRNDSRNKRNIILIENTYNDKNININEIFNKGFSGKENHTGLGLWEIREILKKNNNVNLHTTKNDKYFSQQLEIYY